ncbi:hypothetical protein [Streptomyces sp. TRM70350]|uniref:hypothetical protein n=1 Tax=Streptomyces sp. TRM70350 TaxID=2856165 RepID=UPI001C48D36E|nr:hypothetical protein [Streptomyces sp. TRM70350]MBV7700334.1 hypothetical protein [Streptomyces sp. TRM70350]
MEVGACSSPVSCSSPELALGVGVELPVVPPSSPPEEASPVVSGAPEGVGVEPSPPETESEPESLEPLEPPELPESEVDDLP